MRMGDLPSRFASGVAYGQQGPLDEAITGPDWTVHQTLTTLLQISIWCSFTNNRAAWMKLFVSFRLHCVSTLTMLRRIINLGVVLRTTGPQ